MQTTENGFLSFVFLTMNRFSKKPVFIYLLAVLFILAPVGNLAFTLLFMGVKGWYNPFLIWQWIPYIKPWDWLWLGMTAFAGINLLRARKYSWILAMATLTAVALMNLMTGIHLYGSKAFASPMIVISLFSTSSVFTILYFFRFPYLERRDGWIFYHPRYPVNLPIQFVSDQRVEAAIVNLSRSGALIAVKDFPPISAHYRKGQSVSFQFINPPHALENR